MTKTYTEQWREGTLPDGNYYTVCYKGWSGETFPCNLYYSERLGFDANVKEVLAPVPSYDEYKRLLSNSDESPTEQVLNLQKMVEDECSRRCELERKLAIATKALKGVCVWANTGNGGEKAVKKVCEKALKEMEGVK